MDENNRPNETKNRLRIHKINGNNNIQRIDHDSDSPTKDYFMQKTQNDFIKKSLSPMKSHRVILCNKKTFQNGNVHSTLTRVLKTDIIQIEDLIKKFIDVLPHYITPAKSSHLFHGFGLSTGESDFQKRLVLLQKSEDFSLMNYFNSIVENSKNLHHLYQDFGCQSKEELIMTLSMEIYHLELFLNKINDLAFLFNLKYHNENNDFMLNYNESLSKSSQIQILINKLIEKFDAKEELIINNNNYNIINNKKRLSITSFLRGNSMIESEENVNDINKILEFRTFHEFLNLETEDGVIKHIQSLFIKDNESSISILTNFIFDRVSALDKASYVNKIKMSLRNNDNMENFVVIRKFIEESFNDLEAKNRDLLKELEMKDCEINKLQDHIRVINRRDLKIFIETIAQQNKTLCEKLEDLERASQEDLYEKLKNQSLKNTQLKQANEILKKENQLLGERMNLANKRNATDEYSKLVQEQFSNMQNAFVKERSKLIMTNKSLKQDYERKISQLNEEVKANEEVKWILINRIDEIKNSFDVLNFGINPLKY